MMARSSILEEIIKTQNEENEAWRKIPSFSSIWKEKEEAYRKNTVGTLDELEKGIKKLRDETLKENRLAQAKVREEFSAKWDAIKKRVFEDSLCHEYGEEVLEKMWSIAYEKGHSCGFTEVLTEFDELDDYTYDVIQLVSKK